MCLDVQARCWHKQLAQAAHKGGSSQGMRPLPAPSYQHAEHRQPLKLGVRRKCQTAT